MKHIYNLIKSGNTKGLCEIVTVKLNRGWKCIGGVFVETCEGTPIYFQSMIKHMDFTCMDCKKDTSESEEYYTVNNDLWLLAVPQKDGLLCIDCLEKRLGRRLVKSDFLDNQGNKNAAKNCEIIADRMSN